MQTSIRFRLNGRPTHLETDAERSLLWVLRSDLGLTGTKYGCGSGLCGACTVIIDGQARRSCVTRLAEVGGRDVLTVEGLARNGRLHPLQQAFVDQGGLQCGYCTSGMLMNAYALLEAHPKPTPAQIEAGMEHNLCRCGAYRRIVAAIADASAASGAGS